MPPVRERSPCDVHYETTAQEILDDFEGERLDYRLTGFGTGGTMKGVATRLKEERPEVKVVVCEPTAWLQKRG